jgi:hypothetical protein
MRYGVLMGYLGPEGTGGRTVVPVTQREFELLKNRRMAFSSVLAGLAVFAFAAVTVAATTVVVTPADLGTTWHTADTRPPGTGTFENGPATPPYGTGSFELQTLTDPEKVQLFTSVYDDTLLSSIQGIGYSTYRDPASTGFSAGVAALNLRIDITGDGNPDAYMVYEPYQDMGNAAVQTGVWQDWDAYRGGAAKWWINTGAGGCGQATPCSWSTIVGLFPTATIQEGPNCGPGGVKVPCPGSLGLNQGSFNSGIISNADGLYVNVNGNTTTYDFELTPPPPPQPSTKDDCKKDGWKTLFRADGSAFKNQGDCVQYANTGK